MKAISAIFLCFFLIITLDLASQEISKYDSLCLKIVSSKNIDTWAKQEGEYEYTTELNRLIFDFNKDSSKFVANELYKYKSYHRTKGETIVEEKKDSSYKKYEKTIPEKSIVELIKEKSINKCCDLKFLKDTIFIKSNCCELSNKDFQIEENWLKKNITRKEILKRAKELKVDWKFKKENTFREEREVIFKGYSNVDSLNFFLSDLPKPIHFFTSHSSQQFRVLLTSSNDTIVDLVKIIMPSKTQTPWIDNTTEKEIYNPKINQIIDKLIPKQFLHKYSIKYDYIKESYINWIIERN